MSEPKGFLERVGNAFHALAGKGASISPDMAAWARAEDVDAGGQGAKLVSPYSQSAWVYIAVSILAQQVAKVPFRISRVGGGKARKIRALRGSHQPAHRRMVRRALNADVLESGDVVDLFNRPHPTMNGELFWEMVVTWNALRGEFFILPLDAADCPVDMGDRNPRVQRMVTLPTELFWHIVTGYELTAWRYTGSPLLTPIPSEILLPTEVIHSRSPNPYLYWRGMSPLIVAMTPAQADYAGEQYLKGLWVNNADTGVIVTTDQILADDQRKAIETALRERKRKAGTADRPLFLFGGAKVEKPSLSLLDMQYLETRKFMRSEIFSIFKVPEPLAGFTSDLNDGGAGGSLDAVKGSFVESTIGSLCAQLEVAVDPIVKSFGDDLVGWFDIESLPIMQSQRRARWDTASKMFSVGVPLNDINTTLDLGLPDYKWGKDAYLPFNLQNVSTPPETPSEQPPDDDDDDDDDDETEDDGSEKSNPFARAIALLSLGAEAPVVRKPKVNTVQLWNKHLAARNAATNLFKGKIGKVLMKFRSKALSKLETVHLEKSAGRLGETKGIVDLIFSASEFGHALDAELSAPISSVLQSAGEEVLEEVNYTDPWKYPPKAVVEYLAGRKQSIMGVGGTVRDQLNTTLVEGEEDGDTHLELAARVKAVFSSLTDGEAKRVARTEVNVASNTARHQAMGDAGIEYKAWLGSHSPHPRETHQDVEDATIDSPIPIDEPFEVETEDGGSEQMMFPLDASLGASAGNIINCQCGVLAARKKEEDEKSITFLICGLGTFKFLKADNRH